MMTILLGASRKTNFNRIFVHVRSGSNRSSESFAGIAREVERLWYEAVRIQDCEAALTTGKVRNQELHPVFTIPRLIARENGFAIPEVRSE